MDEIKPLKAVPKAIPRIGLGVLVLDRGHLLLGERKNAHGAGTWSPAGGHLEFGETPQEGAVRELFEETGMEALELAPLSWTNDFFQEEGKHYITLFWLVTKFKNTPEVKEPHKCFRWEWFPLKKLPQPLFLSVVNLFTKISIDSLEIIT